MPDYRTKPSSELTYYVTAQPENSFTFNISRYDTLDEAITKFKEENTNPLSFSSIGVSRGFGEVDIVQRNNNSFIAVTDFLKIPTMKCDREIKNAFHQVIKNLAIVWEYNHDIFTSSMLSSLCIPCVRGNEGILHNESAETLSIKPSEPDNIVTAIDKMYLSDREEWLPTLEVMVLCKSGEHPKIESITINVEDISTKEQGTITVSPQDYLLMADNYLLSHVKGFPLYETSLAFDKLAGDLNDFMYSYDFYGYQDSLPSGGEAEVIENLAKDLKSGNVQPIIDELNSIIAEGDIEGTPLLKATELIKRLEKIVPESEINKNLAGKIKNAKILNRVPNENIKPKDNLEKER